MSPQCQSRLYQLTGKKKQEVKECLIANLKKDDILQRCAQVFSPSVAKGLPPLVSIVPGLTFDQQKELMLIQLEHERMKIDKELALEKIKMEKQLGEMELQRRKLDLVSAGKLSGDSVFDGHGSLESGGASSRPFDIIRNLSLLPKFNERDPDTFLSLFERIADTRGWPVTERTLMLQCAFTGKAQEAYAALSNTDSQSYTKVKAAVLKVYELVPEAYRQHFRNWRRRKTQSHLEFARDLVLHFNRWCTASEVDNFESLCDLILLEQFKTAVPQQIATYVGEKEVKTVAEAAALADDYTLTHKGTFGEPRPYVADSGFRRNIPLFDMQPAAGLGRVVGSVYRSDHSAREVDKVCNYCRKKGHWSLSVMHSGQEVDRMVPRTVRNRKGPVWLPLW